MNKKSFALANFKALDESDGTFEAIVSVFNNVDMIGDKVMPGAFKNSIDKWALSGDPIPVIWSHQWDNPEAHIGFVDPKDATETDDGLKVKGKIDTGKPFAAHVYDLLKERRVKEFSFAYDILDSEKEDDNSRITKLTELDIIEVGPTLKGMNPETQLLAVKAAVQDGAMDREAALKALGFPEKAGRVISAKNESKIKQAQDLLTEVLSSIKEDDGKQAEEPKVKADEPRVKADEPAGMKPSDVTLLADLIEA